MLGGHLIEFTRPVALTTGVISLPQLLMIDTTFVIDTTIDDRYSYYNRYNY